MRLYLDNCCFNRPYDSQSSIKVNLETRAKLHIQEEIKKGKYELVTSYMLEFENSQNSDLMKLTTDIRFQKRYKGSEITILNPLEFVQIAEGEDEL